MKKNISHELRLEKKHHDEVASFYETRSQTDYMWEVPEEVLLFKKITIKKGDKVIDMGCGPSTPITHLISADILNNIEYIGVDISTEMIRLAKKNIPKGKFKIGDMSSIKFPPLYADVIISLGGLHHSIDKRTTLAHWARLLRKNGLLILRDPTYEAFKRGEGESPMEEGVKIEELIEAIKENNLQLDYLLFFNSTAFHMFNRLLIKLGLAKWQNKRALWYPVVYFDVFLSNSLSFLPWCRGLAYAAIITKP